MSLYLALVCLRILQATSLEADIIRAASAYEDIPWINKLVSWVAETANNRPEVKLIGM